MLKEKVARKLHLLDAKAHNITPPAYDLLPDWSKETYLEWAEQTINLFKAEVDKLTVIDDEEIAQKYKGLADWRSLSLIRPHYQDQFQHTKKQLLGGLSKS